MRIDAKEEKVVLGSRGLYSSLPKVVRGGLAYSQETQTVTGTFDKVSNLPPGVSVFEAISEFWQGGEDRNASPAGR